MASPVWQPYPVLTRDCEKERLSFQTLCAEAFLAVRESYEWASVTQWHSSNSLSHWNRITLDLATKVVPELVCDHYLA